MDRAAARFGRPAAATGAAGRAAAPHQPSRGVPPQRGARHHDPGAGPGGDGGGGRAWLATSARSWRWSSSRAMRPLVAGTYLMPSFGRYEHAADVVRRLRALDRCGRGGRVVLSRAREAPSGHSTVTRRAAAVAALRSASMASRPARTLGPRRALLAALAWALLALLSLAPVALAAGPPFGDRPRAPAPTSSTTRTSCHGSRSRRSMSSLQTLQDATGVDMVVFLQVKPASRSARRGPPRTPRRCSTHGAWAAPRVTARC